METETPLTDAQCVKSGHPGVPAAYLSADFAREMERQLRALVASCNEYGGGASISHPRYTRQLSAARKFLENVKEHATLSARARVDHGVDVDTTEKHVNRTADRGCVSRLVRLFRCLLCWTRLARLRFEVRHKATCSHLCSRNKPPTQKPLNP